MKKTPPTCGNDILHRRMTDHYRVHALELGLTEEKTTNFMPQICPKYKKEPCRYQ